MHPEVGEIALDANILPTQDSDLRVVVLPARPGTDARNKLDLLADTGVPGAREAGGHDEWVIPADADRART